MWLRRMRYECAAPDDSPQTRLKHPVIDASESALHQPTLAGRTAVALTSTLSSMRCRFIVPRMRPAAPGLPRNGRAILLFQWLFAGYVGYRPLPGRSISMTEYS